MCIRDRYNRVSRNRKLRIIHKGTRRFKSKNKGDIKKERRRETRTINWANKI